MDDAALQGHWGNKYFRSVVPSAAPRRPRTGPGRIGLAVQHCTLGPDLDRFRHRVGSHPANSFELFTLTVEFVVRELSDFRRLEDWTRHAGGQDCAQQEAEPPEQDAEVVADGGEHGVDGITGAVRGDCIPCGARP